ncbi:hypothetical protein Tco_1003475 [Tanacetum coccineum]|uniref:Reverse transcriptase domain-containing protein n=1 Tax=Tanacetum coccineum TaxID=301880 RepID=A0ABQ5F9K3_9ASTR
MRTRSQARKRRQQQVRQTSVEPPNLEKPNNNSELSILHSYDGIIVTMAQLARGTHCGFEDGSLFPKLLRTTLRSSMNAKIIESKSKVRQSRSKAIVSKVSTSSSTPAVSSDVAERKAPYERIEIEVDKEPTFSYNIIESVNRVDVIDIACEEYVQEVLEISESGNPTSTSDLMIDSRSPSFTPFGGSDFLMEEIDEFLEHDDSIPPGVDDIYDTEGDTVYLEELLSVINSDPNLPPSPVCEINVPEKVKSSCEDPPDLELKDLPSHLEYAFLEGDDKLPVIIAKNLKDEDKTALIKVLKSHNMP